MSVLKLQHSLHSPLLTSCVYYLHIYNLYRHFNIVRVLCKQLDIWDVCAFTHVALVVRYGVCLCLLMFLSLLHVDEIYSYTVAFVYWMLMKYPYIRRWDYLNYIDY